MSQEEQVLLADFGTFSFKFNYYSPDQATVPLSFQSIFGRPAPSLIGIQSKTNFYFEAEAIQRQLIDKLIFHKWQQNCLLSDFNVFEKLLHYMYYDFLRLRDVNNLDLVYALHASPYNTLLFTEFAQLTFELNHVKSCTIINPAVATLAAQGMSSGIVVNLGHETSTIVPVYSGKVQHPVEISNYAITGALLTDYTCEKLNLKKCEEARLFKESNCQVSNEEHPFLKADDNSSNNNLNAMLSKIPEGFFNPSFLNYSCKSIQETIAELINTCEISPESNSIVLNGGTTMVPGFCQRFEKEVQKLVNTTVVAPKDRVNAVWKGLQAIVTSTNFNMEEKVTCQEYEEHGARILKAKWY